MKVEDIYPTVEECLIEWLQEDLSSAEGFLSIELEEYASDDDLEELLRSLHCIATAKGDVLQLTDSTEAHKQNLDKLLIDDPSPSWERVLEALGYTCRQCY